MYLVGFIIRIYHVARSPDVRFPLCQVLTGYVFLGSFSVPKFCSVQFSIFSRFPLYSYVEVLN